MLSIAAVDKAIAKLRNQRSIRTRLYQLRNKALELQDYLPYGVMDDVIAYIDKQIDATLWGAA